MPPAKQYGANGGGATAGAIATAQLPQTGAQEQGNFVEQSRRSARSGYQTAPAFGGAIDQPLPASPGYLSAYRISVYGSGGSTTTGTVALATGSPGSAFSAFAGNIFNNIQVRAANGPPIYSVSDPLAPYLIDLFSGQAGILGAADPAKWPSYSAASSATGTAGTGNLLAQFTIPFEITPGYGCIAVGNAALQPQLHFGLQPSSALWSTAPTTLPGLNVVVDMEYLAAVEGAEPPALGSTLQWTQIQSNPPIGSGSSMKVQLGRMAGWLTTLILIFRDTNGLATDYGWPGGSSSGTGLPFGRPASVNQRLRFYVDGIPVLDEDINTRMNKMYEAYPGLTVTGNRVGPTGVLVYTFRNALSQALLGLADTGEVWIPTSPGSQLEVEGSPWGAFSGPGQITALVGCIVPAGGIRRGLSDLG